MCVFWPWDRDREECRADCRAWGKGVARVEDRDGGSDVQIEPLIGVASRRW